MKKPTKPRTSRSSPAAIPASKPAATVARKPAAKPASGAVPAARAADGGPRRHWLFKSEPGVFSIDDLARAKDGTTYWDGVRNYQARNLLRDEVRVGDLVLFYHSNADPTGVAGVAEVVRGAYADPTQFDDASDHFDPSAKRESPPWVVVDVRFVRAFAAVVSLDALKANATLGGMDVLRRGNRLSVQRVRPEEFDEVLRMAGCAPGADARSPKLATPAAGLLGRLRSSSGRTPGRS